MKELIEEYKEQIQILEDYCKNDLTYRVFYESDITLYKKIIKDLQYLEDNFYLVKKGK